MFLAALVFAQSSSAAPAATCATGYPPATRAQIASSTTTPFVGESIKVSGTCFNANESVALSIGGQSVGTAQTDASGSFDPPVTVPNLLGAQQLLGVGASGEATDRDSLTLTITAAATGGGSGGGGSGGGGGGLAVTGTELAGVSILAVALLVGGALFVTAGRRRRSTVHA